VRAVYESRRQRGDGVRTLLTVSGFLILLLCGNALAQSEPPASVPRITDADEVRAGHLLASDFMKHEGMADTPQTLKIEQYLQTVGDRLAAHAARKLPYRFHFDPDPSFKSAFALPGGEIFVGAGILAMFDTEDQLAAVLGHEMQHDILNQCRDRLEKELAGRQLTVETVDRLTVDPFLPGYGHENEFKADWEGVKLAAQSGYSPEGAIRLLNMFVIMGQQMTHTSSEAEQNLKDRIAQIQRLIDTEKLARPAERALAWP
jgi:beta-barrel assembly-enhancing protease